MKDTWKQTAEAFISGLVVPSPENAEVLETAVIRI